MFDKVEGWSAIFLVLASILLFATGLLYFWNNNFNLTTGSTQVTIERWGILISWLLGLVGLGLLGYDTFKGRSQ